MECADYLYKIWHQHETHNTGDKNITEAIRSLDMKLLLLESYIAELFEITSNNCTKICPRYSVGRWVDQMLLSCLLFSSFSEKLQKLLEAYLSFSKSPILLHFIGVTAIYGLWPDRESWFRRSHSIFATSLLPAPEDLIQCHLIFGGSIPLRTSGWFRNNIEQTLLLSMRALNRWTFTIATMPGSPKSCFSCIVESLYGQS